MHASNISLTCFSISYFWACGYLYGRTLIRHVPDNKLLHALGFLQEETQKTPQRHLQIHPVSPRFLTVLLKTEHLSLSLNSSIFSIKEQNDNLVECKVESPHKVTIRFLYQKNNSCVSQFIWHWSKVWNHWTPNITSILPNSKAMKSVWNSTWETWNFTAAQTRFLKLLHQFQN